MPLHPFTPQGVQDKLKQLYALPDAELFLEASYIEVGFVDWIEKNFSLNSTQSNFLNSIKEEAINYYGSQCALCFRHRLDIILIYPIPTPGYSKWPETSNTIQITADDTGQIEVTGSLTFTMTYRL